MFKQKGLSKQHKQVVHDIHALLQDEGYSFWDAQMVTNLVSASTKAANPTKALDTAHRISEMLKDANVEPGLVAPLLQILANKINEQINQVPMESVHISEV